MELKKPLKRDVTLYEISQYLKIEYQIDLAPQRIYRDRQDGRITAYRGEPTPKKPEGKWYATKAEATRYILLVLSGKTKKENPW